VPPALRCPLCGHPSRARSGNRAWPFCSDRCRAVDLGKWFAEDYRVPAERAGDGASLSPGGEDDPA